ncbi:MAG: hypothetical protein PWQ52_1090, partial [Methanolobus sp.]|nr:hypothetical protein [Methanolobus sp.]
MVAVHIVQNSMVQRECRIMQNECEQKHIKSLELRNSILGMMADSDVETGLDEGPDRELELIFDSMEDQIFIIGTSGRIMSVNRAAVSHLGYSEDELLDMQAGDLIDG